MLTEDTIAAIATPPGTGGIGVIRVSGPGAFQAVTNIFADFSTEKAKDKTNTDNKTNINDKTNANINAPINMSINTHKILSLGDRPDRTIQYGYIIDPEQHVLIDEVLLLLMHGPRSYTAEDVVEIQCHGGIVPVRRILEVLLRHGVRLAERGEFTRRAFLNGRIDLAQAEAIGDILEAKTEDSLTQAVTQLDGVLSAYVQDLREKLITMIAALEVTIDYPEEDLEEVTAAETEQELQPILLQMEDMLASARSGKLVREGILAVIVGRPNAGKSSLMNALLRENRAIVTEIPGTTRDSIEEFMDVDGIPLRLIDTAGLRETEDLVEQLGVQKAKEYLAKADLILGVLDGSTPLTEEEKTVLQSISGRETIIFINKSDQPAQITPAQVAAEGDFTAIAPVSAAKGEGILVFREEVKKMVYGGAVHTGHQSLLGNVRHSSLMERAREQLLQAIESIHAGLPVDFIVTDIRGAWESLGEITGDTVQESLIDELFKRFCLGK